jgi:hypothetical protein
MKRKAQWDYEAEIEGWHIPDPDMPPGWPDNITAPPKDEKEYQQRVAEWRSRQKPAYLDGEDALAQRRASPEGTTVAVTAVSGPAIDGPLEKRARREEIAVATDQVTFARARVRVNREKAAASTSLGDKREYNKQVAVWEAKVPLLEAELAALCQ